MKSLKIVLTALLVMLAGCAGGRSAVFNPNNPNGSISHEDSNYSAFNPSISPIEMTTAYAIKKDADARAEMFNNFMRGEVKTSTRHVLGFINNDRSCPVYLYHSELPGYRIDLKPNGGFSIMEVTDIPSEIVFYSTKTGEIISKLAPDKSKMTQKKTIGGYVVDILFTVNKT